MPQYKLTYFNVRGRAELIRLILAQAGVPYEDKRIVGEDWPKLKPQTPFGSMPILEVDGKVLAGSVPLARFLAERHGLAGTNDIENLEIASLMDCFVDLMLQFVKFRFEKDETRKAAFKKEFDEVAIPKFFAIFEKRITAEGWIYGSEVTYVDIAFFNFVEGNIPAEVLASYPGLKALTEKVGALPNISKWVKDRPVTDF